MSRLTEKVKNNEDYIRLATKDKQEFINKLGRLEDLEEKIGCSFLVVFEGINNGIYDKKGFHYTVILDLDFLRAYPLDLFDEKWQLSDYQKTWWLKEDKSE